MTNQASLFSTGGHAGPLRRVDATAKHIAIRDIRHYSFVIPPRGLLHHIGGLDADHAGELEPAAEPGRGIFFWIVVEYFAS